MKKVFWTNKTNSFKEAEKFNAKFWQRQSLDVKWSALWIMVRDFYKIKGKDASKLRLQRHIQNIRQA